MATLNLADVYGARSTAGATPANPSVQVTGPNQASVTTSAQGNNVPSVAGNASAFSWMGFVIALVLLRIALEAGGESRQSLQSVSHWNWNSGNSGGILWRIKTPHTALWSDNHMNAIFILLLVFLFVFLAATGKWKAILDVVKNPPQ